MTEELENLRINFRISQNEPLPGELERLARILSKKYRREILVYLEDTGCDA